MAKRVVLRVEPKSGGWSVKPVKGKGWFHRKDHAVARGVDTCRRIHRRGGLSQLVVHGKNGKIQFERTYGLDPRRYKG